MILKNMASGIRHPWALFPPLPHLGCVTSGGRGGLLHLSGPRSPQLSGERAAEATTQVVGRMKRSNRNIPTLTATVTAGVAHGLVNEVGQAQAGPHETVSFTVTQRPAVPGGMAQEP